MSIRFAPDATPSVTAIEAALRGALAEASAFYPELARATTSTEAETRTGADARRAFFVNVPGDLLRRRNEASSPYDDDLCPCEIELWTSTAYDEDDGPYLAIHPSLSRRASAGDLGGVGRPQVLWTEDGRGVGIDCLGRPLREPAVAPDEVHTRWASRQDEAEEAEGAPTPPVLGASRLRAVDPPQIASGGPLAQGGVEAPPRSDARLGPKTRENAGRRKEAHDKRRYPSLSAHVALHVRRAAGF